MLSNSKSKCNATGCWHLVTGCKLQYVLSHLPKLPGKVLQNLFFALKSANLIQLPVVPKASGPVASSKMPVA